MPPLTGREAIEVPLFALRWTVRGNVPGEPFTFHYCCTGGGVAETPIALPAGHWMLRVSQTSHDCHEAIHPAVTFGADQWLSTATASTPAWAATLVEVPRHLENVPLRLRIFVEGGKDCCGTSTIDKVELVGEP